MAGNVLAKMEQKQKHEDDMLLRYEAEKEMRQRQLEERRAARQREEQERMRKFLEQQCLEKKERERNDKENINQQAEMWNLDKQNYDMEEKRLRERINKINHDNQQFLLKQMALKNQKSTKMNRNEYAINKPLLKEANEKLKGMSNYEGDGKSQQADAQEA